MSSERSIALALAISMLASLGLIVIYITGFGGAQAEGIGLALALGGAGVAIVIWAVSLLHGPREAAERHQLASEDAEREAAAGALDVEAITRRRFLVRLLAGAGGLLTAALALPAFSLGPQPGRALFETGWRIGIRLVGEDGMPIRFSDVVENAVQTVFPEGSVGRADSPAMLIRLRPSDLDLPEDRWHMPFMGCVAFSKICTHAGCPVGLYRAEDRVLICPCHQSTFDVTRGAVPVFGPAARRLPQLGLRIDREGYLVAGDDFDEPVGPSFWNMSEHETSIERLEPQD